MKSKVKKFVIPFIIVLFVSFIFINIYSFPNGYVGVTNKGGGGIGCICHGTNMPTPSVSVFFEGPDSVAVGGTVLYNMKIAHGPAIVGGFDAAVYAGNIDTVSTESGVWRDSSTGDLTQLYPKPFTNDTVNWTFKYTAPASEQVDTLYAVGNSANDDSTSDNDEWNFSPNFTITVYNPIGITNRNSIANSFRLFQNYPNPFNPETKIAYTIPTAGFVDIEIYDITGRNVSTLIKGNQSAGKYKYDFNGSSLASGVYFYELKFTSNSPKNDNFREIKKMILVK
jgi:hypothetical protein